MVCNELVCKGNTVPIGFDVITKQLELKDQIFVTGYQGNFSLAGFQLVLKRQVAPYIMAYFLPSGLLVGVRIQVLLPIMPYACKACKISFF